MTLEEAIVLHEQDVAKQSLRDIAQQIANFEEWVKVIDDPWERYKGNTMLCSLREYASYGSETKEFQTLVGYEEHVTDPHRKKT